MKPIGERLEVRTVGAATRHVLGDRPIENGDAIEVLLDDGRWLAGRYDWNGNPIRWPGLVVEIGGPWQQARTPQPRSIHISLHPEARLRWKAR